MTLEVVMQDIVKAFSSSLKDYLSDIFKISLACALLSLVGVVSSRMSVLESRSHADGATYRADHASYPNVTVVPLLLDKYLEYGMQPYGEIGTWRAMCAILEVK